MNINRILSPLVGGLLAALLFLWQKRMMEEKDVIYEKDTIRGSISVKDVEGVNYSESLASNPNK